MIRYTLLCEHDHSFESWFDSSEGYDKLQRRHLIECPECGSTNIRKALMTPQISRGHSIHENTAMSDPEESAGMVMQPDQRLQQLQQEALEIARKIREHVTTNADYVGNHFAEEARRIHFDETAPHGIYGEATTEEVRDLKEDGIEIYPLPVLPEDKH